MKGNFSVTEEVEGEEGVERNPRRRSRRHEVVVVMLALMLVLMVGWIGSVGYGVHQREEAREYLEERGYILGVGGVGYDWYRRLVVRWPQLRIERSETFSNYNDEGGVELSDEDWEALGRLWNLSNLFLRKSGIEDHDLVRVVWQSPSLTLLDISENPLTNDSLKHLTLLSELKTLTLESNPQLTDACLVHLTKLTGLIDLNRVGIQITREKVKELLPWVEIVR